MRLCRIHCTEWARITQRLRTELAARGDGRCALLWHLAAAHCAAHVVLVHRNAAEEAAEDACKNVTRCVHFTRVLVRQRDRGRQTETERGAQQL